MIDLLAAARAYLAGTGDPPDRDALAAEVVRLAEEAASLRTSIDSLIRESEERYQAHRDAQAALEEVAAARDAALDACQRRIAEVMRERDDALGSLAEKTGELAEAVEAQAELEAAWKATTIAGCVRGLGVSLAEVITSRHEHFADAARERDEARAALAEARPPLDAVAYLRELADKEERTAGEVLEAADDEAQPIDSEQHEHAAAVLRDAADEIERRRRPPLDPAHVEAVQYIRDRLAREAAKLRDDGFTYLAEERDREIAALEAMLAKEAKP